MILVTVESIQKNITVKKKGKVEFEYKFIDKPIEMPQEHADLIVGPKFKIIKGTKKRFNIEQIKSKSMNELRDFAKKNKLKSKDTDKSELIEEIINELKERGEL